MKDNNLQGQTWPLTTIDCGREDSFVIVTARMILDSISNALNFSDIILMTPNIEKCFARYLGSEAKNLLVFIQPMNQF